MIYFRYHNTNCFFIKNRHKDSYLAIDAGWPGTLREYQRLLKGIGIPFGQIKICIVTHFHMDHAGLITDFLENGIECFMVENQTESEIDKMERTIKKNYRDYREMDRKKLKRVSVEECNRALETEGFPGEVVITDGHSPDSISYISESKEAIVGDLAPLEQIMDDPKSEESWRLLKNKDVKIVYPSHAEVFEF